MPHEAVPFGSPEKVVLQGSVGVVDQVTRLLVLHLCSTRIVCVSVSQGNTSPGLPPLLNPPNAVKASVTPVFPLSATLTFPLTPFSSPLLSWHALRSLSPAARGVPSVSFVHLPRCSLHHPPWPEGAGVRV